MTVKELIEKLKEFPEDMPVGVIGDPVSEIIVSIQTWTHNNFPYDKPDIKFVNIE